MRLDKNLDAMRTRRETVEHPFRTMKMGTGATHFLMKTLLEVATEMALHVLAYNLTRVLSKAGGKFIVRAGGSFSERNWRTCVTSGRLPNGSVHLGRLHLLLSRLC